MRRSIARVVLVVGLAAPIAACVPTYASVGYTTWADMAPPAPYVEVAGAAPAANYVWVNGYWSWSGAQWLWVRGYWAPVPAAGYTWQPSGWVSVSGRYRFVPGRWVGHRHRTYPTYVHPVPRVRVQGRGVPYRTVPQQRRGGDRGRGRGRGRGR